LPLATAIIDNLAARHETGKPVANFPRAGLAEGRITQMIILVINLFAKCLFRPSIQGVKGGKAAGLAF
jgi:hypothetical protein